MMDWVVLIGGLGIGSLLTSIANQYMTRRAATNERLYREKRDAYLGLLGAIHDAAVEYSDEKAKAYALWQTKCDLFGSAAVSKFAQEFVDTNEGPRADRERAFRGLIAAMRSDLLTS